jgi:predicted nucleic acid-binding protein
MPGKAGFFDSSAIVPLCVAQSVSQSTRELFRRFNTQVVARTTLIGTTSTLYQAVALGALTQSNARRALARLEQLENRWAEVVASGRVREVALDVLRAHQLRSGDAIQLASALVWCKDKPRRRSFVCFDQRLGKAADRAGLRS